MPLTPCVYAHMYASAYGGQKRVLDCLELELQVGVSHTVRVLGPELLSSAIALSAPKC